MASLANFEGSNPSDCSLTICCSRKYVRIKAFKLFVRSGEATKGKRWMPWCQVKKKDVESCDKLRGGAEHPLIRRFLNGATRHG
jgi:hypothetical protein